MDDEFYIQPGDTRGLIKEYRYRAQSGFFRRYYGSRWRSLGAIILSLFRKDKP